MPKGKKKNNKGVKMSLAEFEWRQQHQQQPQQAEAEQDSALQQDADKAHAPAALTHAAHPGVRRSAWASPPAAVVTTLDHQLSSLMSSCQTQVADRPLSLEEQFQAGADALAAGATGLRTNVYGANGNVLREETVDDISDEALASVLPPSAQTYLGLATTSNAADEKKPQAEDEEREPTPPPREPTPQPTAKDFLQNGSVPFGTDLVFVQVLANIGDMDEHRGYAVFRRAHGGTKPWWCPAMEKVMNQLAISGIKYDHMFDNSRVEDNRFMRFNLAHCQRHGDATFIVPIGRQQWSRFRSLHGKDQSDVPDNREQNSDDAENGEQKQQRAASNRRGRGGRGRGGRGGASYRAGEPNVWIVKRLRNESDEFIRASDVQPSSDASIDYVLSYVPIDARHQRQSPQEPIQRSTQEAQAAKPAKSSGGAAAATGAASVPPNNSRFQALEEDDTTVEEESDEKKSAASQTSASEAPRTKRTREPRIPTDLPNHEDQPCNYEGIYGYRLEVDAQKNYVRQRVLGTNVIPDTCAKQPHVRLCCARLWSSGVLFAIVKTRKDHHTPELLVSVAEPIFRNRLRELLDAQTQDHRQHAVPLNSAFWKAFVAQYDVHTGCAPATSGEVLLGRQWYNACSIHGLDDMARTLSIAAAVARAHAEHPFMTSALTADDIVRLSKTVQDAAKTWADEWTTFQRNPNLINNHAVDCTQDGPWRQSFAAWSVLARNVDDNQEQPEPPAAWSQLFEAPHKASAVKQAQHAQRVRRSGGAAAAAAAATNVMTSEQLLLALDLICRYQMVRDQRREELRKRDYLASLEREEGICEVSTTEHIILCTVLATLSLSKSRFDVLVWVRDQHLAHNKLVAPHVWRAVLNAYLWFGAKHIGKTLQAPGTNFQQDKKMQTFSVWDQRLLESWAVAGCQWSTPFEVPAADADKLLKQHVTYRSQYDYD